MSSKADIQRQVEEIEQAVAEESSEESEYSEGEDDGLLDRRIKQNEKNSAQSFMFLYCVVGVVTVFCPTYLYMTVLNLDPVEPLNAALYVIVAAVTTYFMVESYRQMYDTESRKASQGNDGKLVSCLEKRLHERASVLDGGLADMPKVELGRSTARTPQELHRSDQTAAAVEWKALSEAQQREYRNRSVAEEVQLLRADIAEHKHMQTQNAMGWTLFFCNTVFISLAVLVSFGLLRSYDPRVSYVVSTLLTGLLVQLLAKQNDEAAKNRADKKKAKV